MRLNTIAAPPQVTSELKRALVFSALLAGVVITAELLVLGSNSVLVQVSARPLVLTICILVAFGSFFVGLNRSRRLREQTEAVDNISGAGLVTLDSNGAVKSWNGGARAIFGFATSDIEAKPFDHLFQPGDMSNSVPADMLRLAAGNGACEHSGWMLRKDGTRLWARSILTPLFDHSKRLLGYSWLILDETLRKIAEDQLRDSHELLDGIVNGTFDIICLKDKDHRYRLVNAAGALFLGRSRDEIEGETDHAFYPASVAARNTAADEEVMRQAASRMSEEVLTVRGEKRTYLMHRTPWRDRGGQVLGVICIATDITDKKRREQQDADLEQYAAMWQFVAPLKPLAVAPRRRPNEILDTINQ